MEEERAPHCPYCFDGEVVKDKICENVYFCNRCHKHVKIKKFQNSE